MNIKRIHKIVLSTVFSFLFMPMTGFTHEPVDPLHPIAVETIGSRLAYPTQVHVQETATGLEVIGKLKRKGHKSKTIRGHVDVELLDSAGQVLENKKASMSPRIGSPKHDHDRNFSVVLALPEGGEFSVRISHNIGGHEH